MHARAVYYIFCRDSVHAVRYIVYVTCRGRICYLKVQIEVNTVCRSIFSRRYCYAVGTGYCSRRSPERRRSFRGYVRFHFTKLVAGDYLQSLHTVVHTALVQLFQMNEVAVSESYNVRADIFKLHSKLCRKLLHKTVSAHVELCLESTGLCVVSRVYYS